MTIYYSILIRILAFLVSAAGSVGGFCIASAKIVKICGTCRIYRTGSGSSENNEIFPEVIEN